MSGTETNQSDIQIFL